MKFKKIDLGDTAQTIAMLGVIAGIVFLAIEMRQNNALLESQVRRQFYEGRIASAEDLIRDASLAEIAVKLGAGEELTPVERLRFSQMIRRVYFNFEWEYDQYQRGQLEKLPLVSWKKTMNFLGEYGEAVWEDEIGGFQDTSPEFVQFMEENVVDQ